MMANWGQSSKLILLQLHETLPENSTLTILRSFGIWSKLERWKNLISECLICWLKIKHFKVSPFLIVRNNKAPFLDWTVMCDEKWILLDNQWQPAQWLDWKEAPKHFPKANFTKKWSWSLVDCCSSDPLQLFESQWNHYIWEVCSAHRWASLQPALTAASTGQQKGPNPSPWQHLTTCHMTNASKVKKKKSWTNWATKSCFILHIHLTSYQLITTSSSILTTFCRENTSTTSRRQKCFFKSSSNPEAWIFMLQE